MGANSLRAAVTTIFAVDIILLTATLLGLLRWREARALGGVWNVLWGQVSLSLAYVDYRC